MSTCRHHDDDWFGSVMLLAGLLVGTVVNAATGRIGLAWLAGALVTFSPLLLVLLVLGVENALDRWCRK